MHTKKIAFTIRAKARERKEWEEGGGGGGAVLVAVAWCQWLFLVCYPGTFWEADVPAPMLGAAAGREGGEPPELEVSHTVHGRGGEGCSF